MPYCSYCGNEVKTNDNFCRDCGNQLEQSSKEEESLKKKGKKRKLVKTGVALLLVFTAFFIINIIISNNLVDQVEEILSTNIKDIERTLDMSVDYSDLTVNAAFGEIVISDLVFEDRWDRLDIDKVTLSSTYAKLKEILETEGDIDEIDKFFLNMKGVRVSSYREEPEFSIEEIDLEFDGYIHKDMELNPDLILDEDQQLSIKIMGMDMYYAELEELAEFAFPQLAELSTIDKMSVDIRHDSNNKQIIFDGMNFTNTFLDTNYSVIVNYSGNSFNNLEFINYEMEGNSKLLFEDLSFGEASSTGEYSIDKLLLEFDLSGVYDDDPYSFVFPEGEINLALEGLNTIFTGEAEVMLAYMLLFDMGLDIGVGMWDAEVPELSINNLYFNFKHNDGQMLIYDTDLDSSLLNIGLEFDLDFNEHFPEYSPINEFKVRVTNVHESLQPILDEIEWELGYLPRDGDDIILEFEGTLGYFDIKQ
ncbi:zinc ribbon domain-containing protein [Natronospora cellulosivora (SeqCode)]